jgi:transcriptional regulator with XRE-family HTH domain
VAERLHEFGPYLTKARLDASERLNRPELRTVAGAARALRIGQSTLYHYEDGTKRPSLEALEQIAEGYGCLVGDLLPSRKVSGVEMQGITGPLMAIPQPHRAMVIRQLVAAAESYAAVFEAGTVVADVAISDGRNTATTITPTEGNSYTDDVLHGVNPSFPRANTPAVPNGGVKREAPIRHGSHRAPDHE